MEIVAVGRLKRGPERELCEKYLNQFAKTGSFSGFSFDGVREIPESRAANAQSRRREEAGWLDQSRGGGQTVSLPASCLPGARDDNPERPSLSPRVRRSLFGRCNGAAAF